MTVDLHERLSEFSYGYGVTREVERLLESIGLKATPFLPSLLDEGGKGFDVKFEKPGKPLLLQFKLGQELQRFRRATPSHQIPSPLQRPFWRYRLNVAEAQFQLLEASQAQAEVYYVAPRFSDWTEFDQAFQSGNVLERSLLLTPADIRNAIQGQGTTHRVVYDMTDRYICSEPRSLPETRPQELAERLGASIRSTQLLLTDRIANLFLRRTEGRAVADRINIRAEELRRSLERSEAEIYATALGLEAWAHGAQLILVTDERT